MLKLLGDLGFGGSRVVGVMAWSSWASSGIEEELHPEENLRVELSPGDIWWDHEFEAGRKMLVNCMRCVKMRRKGEEGGRNDGDVGGDCAETTLEGLFEVRGEGIG